MDRVLSAATIFLGSFLLFQLQPILARAILPWFGGSAAVWTTCMLFFQAVLFFGYWYAHGLVRTLPPRSQAILHAGALAVSLLCLPVIPDAGWKPAGSEDPIPRILGLLAMTAGLPYFLLSSTSPLVQAWYARRSESALPYRFFALSNLASLLALLAYPTLIEPAISLRRQTLAWSVLYAFYVLLCGWLALRSAHIASAPVAREASVVIPFGDRMVWLLLAACPSILSLAVTNHLCQNVAAIPFLWILPLSVYLLSFILCFDRDEQLPRPLLAALHAISLAGLSYLLLRQTVNTSIKLVIPAVTVGLFFCCMFCHGELVRRKPAACHLTSFYLMISLGGALGAGAVGLLAPYLLKGFYELPLGLAVCAFFTLCLEYRKNLYTDLAWMAVAVFAIVAAAAQVQAMSVGARFLGRNFYGGLRVVDLKSRRAMIHGTINHGTQFLDPARRALATTYYSPGSGVQMAIDQFRRPGQRVGVIGLGVGTLATYARPGDYYRFYELNPMVLELARREFTFLRDAAARVDVVLGDGRLSLEREPDQQFDVLVVDAFSGDSIPVHLLSREAFQLYFRHLRPGGVLAVHVSNTALDLTQVVGKTVQSLGKASLRIHAAPDAGIDRSESEWILATDRPEPLQQPRLLAAASPSRPAPGLLVWTDDYSTLFPLLK